jgi:acid stress-induced BolA-like protein IbaG/YrbA
MVEEKRKFYASLGPNIENNEIHNNSSRANN